MYLLGYDIGSSSVKAAIVNAKTRKTVAITQHPKKEMSMISHKAGWAEQNPENWWHHLCIATKELLAETDIPPSEIKSIGIAYQMHGLVVVDKSQNVLRPSIIWCDSRAIDIGNDAFSKIGKEQCLSHLLNSPGNFTASKLKWVKNNEPDIFEKIDKIMLPGDYIAMKLTGECSTTISGLSEGMFWDFKTGKVSSGILDYFELDQSIIPHINETSSIQGRVSTTAALECGLSPDTPVTYRAGDQPNNALSLNVLDANEVAATGGTSGVIYAVVDQPRYDPQSRVNSFAHVNHKKDDPKIGVLLCINGTGIQYAWMKENVAQANRSYPDLESEASTVKRGSERLAILPFGNGAERMLCNQNIGSQIHNLQFNTHGRAHLYRAALEGIAFSFYYGFQILSEMGLQVSSMKVGNDNLFQSTIFSKTVSTLLDTEIKVINTTGAVGAAQASGVAIGIFNSFKEATSSFEIVKKYEPDHHKVEYDTAYSFWLEQLKKHLD